MATTTAWGRFLDTIGMAEPSLAPIPVAPSFLADVQPQVNPVTAQQRWDMGHQIFLFERELDTRGHLEIENLPANDGGGAREVAGINMRYDGPEEAKLEQMVKAGQYDQAESEATKYIIENTDPVMKWCSHPSIECYLRDIYFNRGGGGCMKILQKAIGVKVDGAFGPISESTEKAAEGDLEAMLDDLYTARVWYEDDVIGIRANLDKGLMNRFAEARDFAKMMILDVS